MQSARFISISTYATAQYHTIGIIHDKGMGGQINNRNVLCATPAGFPVIYVGEEILWKTAQVCARM